MAVKYGRHGFAGGGEKIEKNNNLSIPIEGDKVDINNLNFEDVLKRLDWVTTEFKKINQGRSDYTPDQLVKWQSALNIKKRQMEDKKRAA